MSRSEFRWNKKRKHYAYLFKDINSKRKYILITSKRFVIKKKNGRNKIILVNVPLVHHPNREKDGQYYLIPKVYIDEIITFDEKVYKDWRFNKHDKRKVKRIKSQK